MKDERFNIYAALNPSGDIPWDQAPQQYLGYITWKEAVEWARKQKRLVRLSKSSGYYNQGYYIR